MKIFKNSKFLYFIPVVLLFSGSLFAQSFKGKISGKILDSETRAPLPFVNVLLSGTRLGGSSDENGNYFILNVPPGEYNLVASLIGYSRTEINEITVSVDRTTTQNINMKPATVTTKTVTIVAERPVIIKDQTSSSSSLEAKQIEKAPVEGLRGVLELNAGIQQGASGNYSVRGSGSYELNYQINGVEQVTTNTGVPGQSALTEKANNSWKYDFNPLGVQQMEIISGGFSAEYGNAQAGVVKVVTKEGGMKLNGEIRFEYRPPGQYHYGPFLYGAETYEWKKWGDFQSWRNYFPDSSDGYVRKMYNQWINNHSPSDDNRLGVYDYRDYAYKRILFGVGGPLGRDPERLKFYLSGEIRNNPTRIPTIEKVQEYQNFTLTTTYYPVGEHKIKFMGMYQFYHGGLSSGSEDIRWAGRSGSWKYALVQDPTRDEITLTQGITWTYSIGTHAFLETAVNHQNEKVICPYRYAISEGDSWLISTGPWREDAYYRQPFSFTTLFEQDSRTDMLGFTSNYVNQISTTNQLKAGIKANYWQMEYSGITGKYEASAFVTATGYAEYYKAQPFTLAAYIQDKMEYEGMIANLGVRFDGYNFNSAYPLDRYDPFYQGLGAAGIGNPLTQDSKFHYSILPRIGISFPIGTETAFRLQYGHFSSMPLFNQALTKRSISGWDNYGYPDLDPKKTINYEIGLQQSIGNTHRVDLVLYYNDRVDQVSGLYIYAPNTGSQQTQKRYYTFDNNGYGSSKGIELTLEKFSAGNWSYRISYSLSETKFGNYGPQVLYSDDPDDPRNYQTRNFAGDFLSYEDRTHNFRAYLQYSSFDKEGIEFFGIMPFSNLNVGLTYSAQSGIPFTYITSFDQFQDVVNNRRYPLESKFDLNISKRFKLLSQDVSLGIRVMNLFDNKWITPMGGSTDPDLKNWIERGVTKDDPADDPARKSYILDYFTTYRNVPRQVFFTFGLGF